MNEETQNLPVVPQRVTLGVVRGDTPKELVAAATAAATELANVIKSRGLSSKINGRDYVRCEGWTTLAAIMGVMPREVSVTESNDDGDTVFVATVELIRMSDGMVLTRASAECGSSDEMDRNGKVIWAERPRYARRSMAITRATSKACRIAFSWVMVLAGYEATPAEEVPDGGFQDRPVHVATTGEVVVPFGKSKGTPLSRVGNDELKRMREWCVGKGKFSDFVTQVDNELESRRESLDQRPKALDETDEDEALAVRMGRE